MNSVCHRQKEKAFEDICRIIGATSAAVIEGRETRAQTGLVQVALNESCRLVPEGPLGGNASSILQVPVPQVVVYGWYDNEPGSFVNMMGERTTAIAKSFPGA
jgi:glyceraldehyde 3-phosphate dehydrogenase